MTLETIKIILESPHGLEAFNSWMLLRWARFGYGVVLTSVILYLLYLFVKYLKEEGS